VFASSLPDAGSLEFPAAAVMVSTFLATAYAFASRASRGDVQWTAFVAGFVGAGFGLFVWTFGLITGLY
jgi:hypothetical protein